MMSREELRRIHEMEQQATALNNGDRGRFATLENNALDYLQKLIDQECGVKNARPTPMGSGLVS